MISFKIPAMHCGGCARRVRAAILAAEPSAAVEIDVGEHAVAIAGVLSVFAYAKVLATAGYPPDEPAG